MLGRWGARAPGRPPRPHPCPHLHVVTAAPAEVWQGECDVAALPGGLLCRLQGRGAVRPWPLLGCAPRRPQGERLAGPAPGGAAPPQGRGCVDSGLHPAPSCPAWLWPLGILGTDTPVLHWPYPGFILFPHLYSPLSSLHILKSSNPFCNNGINKAKQKRTRKTWGRGGQRAGVQGRDSRVPSAVGATTHQPHSSHTWEGRTAAQVTPSSTA